MYQNTTIPPLNPRDFISTCRELVGDSYLIKLFNVSIRTLQRWVAKLPYVSEDSVRENYLEKHERLLERLQREPGGMDIARGIVERHAHKVGCELHCIESAEPDQCSIEAECLDDYPALTKFHQAIRENPDADTVRHLWQEAKRELDETYEMYSKTLDKKEVTENS